MLNTVYAYLVEQMDAADRAASPVFLAAGVKPADVDDMSRRDALEKWLAAPDAKQAAGEAALVRFLTA